MSIEAEAVSGSTFASEIQLKASRWVIDRQLAESWSAEDQTHLDAWLAESAANRVAYLRANQAWSRTARAAALRQPKQGEGESEPAAKLKPAVMRSIATAGILALIGVVGAQYFHGGRYSVYTTPVGGRQVLTLSDGSQIELNTDSAVRIADSKNAPEVIVDKGEVYFDVKHDPARHFSVLAGGRRISDLGTKFLVRENPDRLEVALLEGRVRLEALDGSSRAATNLTPGDLVVATAESTTVSRQAPAALSNEMSWRQGVLVFYHTTLAQAAAEFNRYNDRKVVVADAKIGKLEINGTFRTNDVDMFTDVTADVLGLHVEKLDGKTLVGR